MASVSAGLLWAALILVAIEVVRYAPHRQGPEFGVTAVALVAYLDAISFMAGFSIGWALSILNTVLGLILTALAAHYRRQIFFATLVSFLLASSLRGYLPLAPYIHKFYVLPTLLAITALGAAVQVVRGWRRKEKRIFSSAGIVMVACLAGMALVTSSYPSLLITGLALFTAGVSALMGIFSTQYRLSFSIVGAFSLLLAVNWLLEL